ncbi:MAG: MarR family winged helix-turn-helix transcriptional regulator [Lachnospiraceae bacterium]|nr:MarR family winged helix-turn-helix transcriptional regulator [Lachnospiraceae bacterium]
MERSVVLLLHGREFKQLLESRSAVIRERYGLRKIDVEILYYLHQFGERNTSKDIRDAYMFTKGHISQSVERLQKMRLLEPVPDVRDRRCIHLKLTPEAEDIVCSIGKMWEEMTAAIFEGITEQEKHMLYEVAVKMTHNMKRALVVSQRQEEADTNGL